MSNVAAIGTSHKWFEDLAALLIGTSLVALGILFLKHTGMVTGGTAGLSLFLHYKLDYQFGTIFFLINLPFYYLSIRQIGWEFTLKTIFAVSLLAFISNYQHKVITIEHLHPFYGAIFGGFLFGTGFIVLFRHKASLGGFSILALFLQDKFGIRAGWVLMSFDIIIMLISLSVVSIMPFILSVICVVVLNFIIAFNHRSDRYSV